MLVYGYRGVYGAASIGQSPTGVRLPYLEVAVA